MRVRRCVSASVRQCVETGCGCTSPGIRSYSPGNNRTLRIQGSHRVPHDTVTA